MAQATTEQRREFAHDLAQRLPLCGDEDDPRDDAGDYISLCDLVVTGIEVPWQHWFVRKYDPDATGEDDDHAWAIIEALPSADVGKKVVHLTEATLRQAVEDYAFARLEHGMSEDDVKVMVDGTYTDAIVGDSILQHAIYGKDVYS